MKIFAKSSTFEENYNIEWWYVRKNLNWRLLSPTCNIYLVGKSNKFLCDPSNWIIPMTVIVSFRYKISITAKRFRNRFTLKTLYISSIQAHPMFNCFRMRFWSLGWRVQGPIRWQKLPSATRLTLVRLSAANSMTVTDATAAVGAAAWSEDQLYLKEFLHK